MGGVLDVGMGKFSPSTAVHSIIIGKYLQFALRSVLIRKNKIKVTCELKGCYNSSFLMNKKKNYQTVLFGSYWLLNSFSHRDYNISLNLFTEGSITYFGLFRCVKSMFMPGRFSWTGIISFYQLSFDTRPVLPWKQKGFD